MASTEIKSLVKFLQDNGGLVISGQTKFTVIAPILKEMNLTLQTIKEDLFVSKITSSDLINKYSKNDELLFLYDFVKKTPKLKISHSMSNTRITVDVSDFVSLKYLELCKVNVKDVKGIHNLRESLEAVLCFRCLENLCDLLLNSESEQLISCMWSKLRYLVLSRNNLTSLDESFIHTPWLQYLDLSYNNLEDIRPLTCLRNLTHLNVSYNHLKEIPKFHVSKLKFLLLNNNYISDISGIATLESLQELNLSNNCVAEHGSLIALVELPSLKSLNLLSNPINYHPMYRSFTCGYLHENIANAHFLLDGQALSNSEREFIRYSSRSHIPERFETKQKKCSIRIVDDGNGDKIESKIEKRKSSKRLREPRIADSSESNIVSSKNERVPSNLHHVDEDSDGEEFGKQVESLRKQYGSDYWLIERNIGTLEELIPDLPSSFKVKENLLEEMSPLFSSSPNLILPNMVEEFSGIPADMYYDKDEAESEDNTTLVPAVTPYESQITDESEQESSEEEDFLPTDLWVVEKIDENSKDSRFLVLNDFELKELDTVKRKVITRWGIDSVDRYTKISSEPFTLTLYFDVPKRENRFRKYIMEYADAKVLMNRIDKELEERHLKDQIVLKCIKCDFVFCYEKPKRKLIDVNNKPQYVCPTCRSTAVIEEDMSEIEDKKTIYNNNNNSVNVGSYKQSSPVAVTPSPSLSSIGSAASLERNSDAANNEESLDSYHESDVEIISNPSESSVEVLHRVTNGIGEEHKTVLQRLSEKLSASVISNDLPSVTAVLNEVLTESSSSGSMTDSSCTTIESNYHLGRQNRFSHNIDQVLEESSTETSPQQRCSEERNTSDLNKNNKNDISNVFTITSCVSALEEVLSKVLPSTPSQKTIAPPTSSPFNYSYTDFSSVDYRIKFYLWGEVIPNNEEITAFIKVQAIAKSNQPGVFFPGLVALTSKKLYMVKITSKIENEDNFGSWLQKYDSVNTEKIMLFKPLLWKQGFCVETSEKSTDGSCIHYLMFLYDEKRTDNYLGFIKDLGSVHVQKSDDCSTERSAFSLIQTDENIRNLTMSDCISVNGDHGTSMIHNFVALIVTNSKFIILKGEVDWLLPDSLISPIVIREDKMTNLIGVKILDNEIVLPFIDEIEDTEKNWKITTVNQDATNRIVKAIQEPWEELFGINLPFISV